MPFHGAIIPPPPPPGPVRVVYPIQEASLKDHLSFLTLDTGLDKDGNVRITRQQYEFFAGINYLGVSSKDGLLVISLWEFAGLISLAVHGNNKFLKALAEVLLPKLKALASPDRCMPATRFYGESLVKLLGRRVEFREGEKSRAEGIFEGSTSVRLNTENQYILRIGGEEVPWEFTLGMRSLADCSYSITLCE